MSVSGGESCQEGGGGGGDPLGVQIKLLRISWNIKLKKQKVYKTN